MDTIVRICLIWCPLTAVFYAGPWEEHETVFESRAERAAAGRAVDGDFMPLSETPNISALVFGTGGDIEGGQQSVDDVCWRPAFQSVSQKAGGGDGGGARTLPAVGGSAPTQQNPIKARGSPKQQQQQQQQQQRRRRQQPLHPANRKTTTVSTRSGATSVGKVAGTGPPPDPFYSQVGKLILLIVRQLS